MIEGYTTVKDIAEKWNIKPRTVQIMCAEGKIPKDSGSGKVWERLGYSGGCKETK